MDQNVRCNRACLPECVDELHALVFDLVDGVDALELTGAAECEYLERVVLVLLPEEEQLSLLRQELDDLRRELSVDELLCEGHVALVLDSDHAQLVRVSLATDESIRSDGLNRQDWVFEGVQNRLLILRALDELQLGPL